MEQQFNSPEEEWVSKFDFDTGRLKVPNSLSNEAYEWARLNSDRTSELEKEYFRVKDIEKELEVNNKLKIIYDHIVMTLKYYTDLKEEYYHLIALWIIGTYLHSTFSTFPYLFLNAMRGSAKSRTLKLIASMAFKADNKVHAGINETTLYRTEKGATLVLDEVENIGKKEKGELREYLNASYKKGVTVARSAKRSEKGNEKYVVEHFEPFRPIAMANIFGMEEVLGDRCITLILEKSHNPYFIKIIEDLDNNPTIESIKRTLEDIKCSLCSVVTKKNMVKGWNNYIKSRYIYTTTLTTQSTITTLTTLPHEEELIFNQIDSTGIDGRNLELFLPLLMTSLLLGKEVFDRTLVIATDMVKSKKTEEFTESKDISFIDYISKLNASYQIEYRSINDLTKQFREFLGEQDDEDRWLNSKWVGRALKRLNLTLDKRRVAKGVEVTLNISKAIEKTKQFHKITDDKKEE